MSIFFNFDVGPNSRRFRRAVDGDKADIQYILDRSRSDKLFGDVDIGSLIELSVLSICMIDEAKDVTGFMALDDHPNVPSVDEADWENWMRNMFQKYHLSRNTLFIHFMCCVDEVTDVFLEEALVSVFHEDVYLLNIVLIVPNGCPEGCILRYIKPSKRNFCKYKYNMKRTKEMVAVQCNYMYTAMRQDFCPKLKVRRAVEEDNDDIIQLLDQKCPRLKELYGDYYISEIIGRHPEMKRKIIVADHQDRAIAVMCLNTEINYDVLQSTYELHPYHGLKKATSLEKEKLKRSNELLKTFGEPILLGKWGPFDHTAKMKQNTEKETSHETVTDLRTAKTPSKVFFRHNSVMENSIDRVCHKKETSDDYSSKFYAMSPTLSLVSNISVAHLLDEDPFDYEIINIDAKLLTTPHVLSVDSVPEISKMTIQSRIIGLEAKLKRRTSLYTLKNDEAFDGADKKYTGEPNAFIIELMGFHENLDYRHAFDLLEASFEAMSSYDYCIIRVPSSEKAFPLLQNFCLVPTKPNIFNKYALYVAHRSAILGKLRVRSAELIDVPLIAQMLNNLDVKETLWTVENSIQMKKEEIFVMLSGSSIVGLGVLEKAEQLNFIQNKYNIDSYRINKYHYRTHGISAGFSALKTVLIYPVFEVHFRFFAREMMRLSNRTALFWMTAYRNKWMAHKANTLAISMIPLMPRKSEVDCAVVPEIKKSDVILNTLEAFSTWFISKKFTTVPRLNVDARIVVVGASRTAMAFLNALLFSDSCSYLTFTNVTLISPNGLPYVRHSKGLVESMFLKCRTNRDKYLKTVPYTYYVNVVQGTLVEIHRQSKYITLANRCKYHYDFLFLLFGNQYQHPNYMKNVIKREKEIRNGQALEYTRLDVPKCNIDVTEKTRPKNFFIINNLADANKALKYIRNNLLCFESYSILVYGATIHSYCCLSTLLQMGVPQQNIVFVEPFPPENPRKSRVTVFANKNVDSTVQKVMENMNIKIYRSYYYQSWSCDEDNLVTSATFVSQHQLVDIPCSAIFYYGRYGIDEAAFVAVNDSGIAYNKGILIDHQFKTKDDSIYAAGPATRYNSKYYADDRQQMYYDSYEIGTKLGEQIRNQLDPLFEYKPGNSNSRSERKSAGSASTMTNSNEKDSTSNLSFLQSLDPEQLSVVRTHLFVQDKTKKRVVKFQESLDCLRSEFGNTDEKLPQLKRPDVKQCVLPGGLRYLEVRSPGKKTPCYYIQSLNYNGHVIETFKDGYFKLHLNKDLIVDGITCLTPDMRPLDNFANLYGLSAVVLNNVFLRYTAKKLDNLYAFFRSSWAYFLYHDKCDELFAMVKELLPKGQKKGATLKEVMHSIAEKLNVTMCAENAKEKMRSTFETSPYIEAITDYVIDWLSENENLLPVYLQSWHQSEFSRDVNSNPAFKKRKRSIIRMLNTIY